MGYIKRNDFNKLKGLKVLSVHKTEEMLTFKLGDGVISYRAIGGCCSSSFIEDMDSPEIFNNGMGLITTAVKSVEFPKPGFMLVHTMNSTYEVEYET